MGQLEIFSTFRSFTVELGNLRPKFEIHDGPRPKTDAWEVRRSSWGEVKVEPKLGYCETP